MRLDRSELADQPDNAHMARRAGSAPDDPDAAGKTRGKEASGGSAPDSSSAISDSALRTERNAAYHANVNAVYRQYAIDHVDARAENLEHETVTPEGPLAEAADRKRETSQGLDDTTAAAPGGSAPGVRDGWMRDLILPRDRSGEYDGIPRTQALLQEGDLPEGYTSSPALKGDPYHPDSVTSRSTANQELYAPTSRDRAEALGYTTRIPAQKSPFDSHGQEVFTNGKNYITSDADGHNVTDGWKMFSRRGVRIGTYDSELNYVKE